jgi:hypothetical protein
MPTYLEFCAAALAWQAKVERVNAIADALPDKIRDALSQQLGAPTDYAAFATSAHRRPCRHVELFRREDDGEVRFRWTAFDPAKPLQRGDDKAYRFHIGIAIEGVPDAGLGSIIYFSLIVEKIEETQIRLAIENMSGEISFDPREDAEYLRGGAAIASMLTDFSTTASGNRANPIGFQRG